MSSSSPFLRQPQRTRRRRSGAGTRALGRLARIVLVAAPLAGVAWWLLIADGFRLVEVVATGSPRVGAAWIKETLAPEIGSNLLTLPLSRVEERVLRHPWSARVTLRKELPGRLHVEVADRQALAILEESDRRLFIGREGKRIDVLGPEESAGGLLSLRLAGAGAAARNESALLRTALEVADTLSEVQGWKSSLRRVEILGDDCFRLYNRSLPFPVLVQLDNLGPALQRLSELAPEIVRRFHAVDEVDLRIAGRIVIRPRVIDEVAPI